MRVVFGTKCARILKTFISLISQKQFNCSPSCDVLIANSTQSRFHTRTSASTSYDRQIIKKEMVLIQCISNFPYTPTGASLFTAGTNCHGGPGHARSCSIRHAFELILRFSLADPPAHKQVISHAYPFKA
jgi:hypothetical protein